ncbi:MAG: hypothetical protein LBL46_02945 [Rickettsiales bacterium]|jgi:hypothetical protein|nr:hypothetical protein [Rickettsiales bacterium]
MIKIFLLLIAMFIAPAARADRIMDCLMLAKNDFTNKVSDYLKSQGYAELDPTMGDARHVREYMRILADAMKSGCGETAMHNIAREWSAAGAGYQSPIIEMEFNGNILEFTLDIPSLFYFSPEKSTIIIAPNSAGAALSYGAFPKNIFDDEKCAKSMLDGNMFVGGNPTPAIPAAGAGLAAGQLPVGAVVGQPYMPTVATAGTTLGPMTAGGTPGFVIGGAAPSGASAAASVSVKSMAGGLLATGAGQVAVNLITGGGGVRQPDRASALNTAGQSVFAEDFGGGNFYLVDFPSVGKTSANFFSLTNYFPGAIAVSKGDGKINNIIAYENFTTAIRRAQALSDALARGECSGKQLAVWVAKLPSDAKIESLGSGKILSLRGNKQQNELTLTAGPFNIH